ncbi:N-acetylmuramic acid 6-phosphate etherase [Clostridium polynesiense]|uniref:N-acetylmuramic acid 6-phosphate etherase n=1 Tax=Clostridium polynesiense TaxID=1325933 RepID=UPI00058CFBF4|nr:N-acetylmuramic acid 6-phosphate etherase [Clostridium polynesiense]
MELKKLETEQINQNTINIDTLSTLDIVNLINSEDEKIPAEIKKCNIEIQTLIDEIVERIKTGGRLIYIGAGTSGRLGILDASECPPTFGVSYELVQGIIAGGKDAIIKAKEGAEDSKDLAVEDLKELGLTEKDTVIGLAASGRTPYVIGGLDYANSIGAFTGAISCVSNSTIGKHAKVNIEAIVGPEVVTGSTRMKAGTAQKMILNIISTTTMIKLGKVYKNLMVDVQATNEKLVERSKRIIMESTSCDMERASALIELSNQSVKHAILMELTGKGYDEVSRMLEKNEGNISKAIREEIGQ